MKDIQKELNDIMDIACSMGCEIDKLAIYKSFTNIDFITDSLDLEIQNKLINKITDVCEHLKLSRFTASPEYFSKDNKIKISIEFNRKIDFNRK